MYVITVEFVVEPEEATKFLELLIENATLSKTNEPGCLQFDVCRDPDTPNVIFLYEVYTSSEAFETHITTDHFLSFDAATAPMVKTKTVHRYREVWQ